MPEKSQKSHEELLEDLARSVGKGFQSIDQRFDQVEKEIGKSRDELRQFQHEVRKEFAEVRYVLSDVVRRDEHLELKQRVDRLETRAK